MKQIFDIFVAILAVLFLVTVPVFLAVLLLLIRKYLRQNEILVSSVASTAKHAMASDQKFDQQTDRLQKVIEAIPKLTVIENLKAKASEIVPEAPAVPQIPHVLHHPPSGPSGHKTDPNSGPSLGPVTKSILVMTFLLLGTGATTSFYEETNNMDGLTLLSEGKYKEADEKLASEGVNADLYRAEALICLGRLTDAVDLCNRHPKERKSKLLLGVIAGKRGDHVVGETFLTEAKDMGSFAAERLLLTKNWWEKV